MLITCPSCASHYTIDASRIRPGGRKVRCAACRDSWIVEAIDETPAEEPERDASGHDRLAALLSSEVPAAADEPKPPPAVIDVAPERRRPRPASPSRGRGHRRPHAGGKRMQRLAVASAALVLLALPAALPFRSSVVGIAPGTAPLFAAVGLPVNVVGIGFANVVSRTMPEAAGSVLEIGGTLTNLTGRSVAVPPLLVAIESAGRRSLLEWTPRGVTPAELDAGVTVPFRIRLPSPPPAGRRVQVTFAELAHGSAAVASR